MRTAQPIRDAHDWASLIAQLARHTDTLLNVPAPLAMAVLAAPAAVAYWIAARMDHLADRPALALLVIGAETTDACDQGRWYQLLPSLLGRPMDVAVTLLGPELDIGFASSAAERAPSRTAHCVCSSLDRFLAETDAQAFDLAVVFHPGLQKHRGWLTADGFARLITMDVPLIASSYETDEYEMDRWVLESYGYRVAGEPLVSPFFLELGDQQTSVRWGRVLWQVDSPPGTARAADEERLAALDNLTSMVMHSMMHVAAAVTPPYGAEVELRASSGARSAAIHIFDNRFVDIASGNVSRLEDDGELRSEPSVPRADIDGYPRGGSNIERAIWAARVKQRYLLSGYEEESRAAQDAGHARAMFLAMRERAARLFKL